MSETEIWRQSSGPSRPTVRPWLVAVAALVVVAFGFGPAVSSASAKGGAEVTPKIIGGNIAPDGSWPSQTALLAAGQSDPFVAQFCGGTLIDPYWVLTAAHCIDFLTSPSQLQVAIGINDLNAISSGDRKAVRSILIHPDWDPESSEWDFALLELAVPSGGPVTDLIVPSEGGETVAGKPAEIAGWGCTIIGTETECYSSGFLPELREASVSFISDATCQSSWPPDPTGFSFDAEMMICAGIYPAGGVDTCIGDSGGPLTALVDGRRVLAGVTSWGGLPCGLPSSPGVYARVLAGRPWILNTIEENLRLEVTRSGTGSGTVTSSPSGISCGSDCSNDFSYGTEVTLTAKAASGSGFTGWSGACSGSGPCEITLEEASLVNANFKKGPTISLKSKPPKRTHSRKATFRFKASQSGSNFKCRIDGKSWQKCKSPKTYKNLKRGRNHTFRVKATRSGITGPVKKYTWSVKRG